MTTRGFAVIDLETTGLQPAQNHRIIEVGVVHVDLDGQVTNRWQTVVHPDRDLGPTHIHGLTGADMRNAPKFAEISDELRDLLDERVIVAHNATFESRFLTAEWMRAGALDVEEFPGAWLDTMRLASKLLPGAGRKLADCCAAYDIDVVNAHSALGDAEATALLLAAYLDASRGQRFWNRVLDAPFAAHSLRPLGRRGLAIARSSNAIMEAAPLARVVAQLPADEAETDGEADYLALLDRSLEDALLTLAEAGELERLAAAHGITAERCRQLHAHYFEQVADAAWADGVLTNEEVAQLDALGHIMSLNEAQIAAAKLTRAATEAVATDAPVALHPGQIIVLTGSMRRPREDWQQALEAAGFLAPSGLTKKTDVLVAADPDSLSGKAKKARQYGIPIVSEDWLEEQLGAIALA